MSVMSPQPGLSTLRLMSETPSPSALRPPFLHKVVNIDHAACWEESTMRNREHVRKERTLRRGIPTIPPG